MSDEQAFAFTGATCVLGLSIAFIGGLASAPALFYGGAIIGVAGIIGGVIYLAAWLSS